MSAKGPLVVVSAVAALVVGPHLTAQAPESEAGHLSEATAFRASLWGTVLPIVAGVAHAGTDATDPGPLAYGLMRIGSAFADDDEFSAMVFSDVEAARAWLREA